MLEFLFPRKLRRLNYFFRALPLNLFLTSAIINLETANEVTSGETLLCVGAIAAGLYMVAFVYLPRARDAGLPAWSLVFGFIPYLSSLLGLLLLFRPSHYSLLGPRAEEQPRTPVTVAGSHCAICGKRLIFRTDGLFNESNEVVCNECHASPAPPAT